jgi:hypothetical protein
MLYINYQSWSCGHWRNVWPPQPSRRPDRTRDGHLCPWLWLSQSMRKKTPQQTWIQSQSSYGFPWPLWRDESDLFRSCSLCTDQDAAGASFYIAHRQRQVKNEYFCLLGDQGELTLVSGSLDGQVSTKHELPGQEANIVVLSLGMS